MSVFTRSELVFLSHIFFYFSLFLKLFSYVTLLLTNFTKTTCCTLGSQDNAHDSYLKASDKRSCIREKVNSNSKYHHVNVAEHFS